VGKKSAIGEVVKPGDYRALREGQNSLLVGKAHGGALGVEKVEKGPGAAWGERTSEAVPCRDRAHMGPVTWHVGLLREEGKGPEGARVTLVL